jgi:hypothetical protein
MGRRLALLTLIIVLGIRNYGSSISSWFRGPDPDHGIAVTRVEFRPDVGTANPAWIIGLKNTSPGTTYNRIELEATYKDQEGKILEVDKLFVRQKLGPGEEQLIASTDTRARPGAVSGTLKVLGASNVKP